MLTVFELVSYFKSGGRQDVTLLSVVVVKKCDTTISIWVIFDSGDGRWNSVFIALEIDYSVTLLVATTAVA